MASTLSEYLDSQDELVREAALALPHQFSQCTYPLGPLRYGCLAWKSCLDRTEFLTYMSRQAVYLCTTCPEARGLCAACSVACHTDHEQVELYDWFHESCCNLRERPGSRANSPEVQADHSVPEQPLVDQSIRDQQSGNEIGGDAASETSSSGLPPPLITGDEYESFVCGACVSRNPTLKRWAGTCGAMMVVRDTPSDPWSRLNGSSKVGAELIQIDDPQSAVLGIKRPLSPSAGEGPETKRVKNSLDETVTSTPSCLAPDPEPLAQKIFGALESRDPTPSLGAGDVFFTLGFKERWCQCDLCLASLKMEPYLLHDEETYEPPEDPDSGLSLEELGMRALSRLPRDKAIDGIHAFNEMRNDLVKFLRPFAQDGKVVNETDVRDFFASLKEAAKKGRE
ncbi:hypothetical protein CVT25_005140 [Psilocybe cyanescens]|uniref:UBR-type domain-containing protein n=1 Tax=Psilocybe cyanescens TaxID=93625 RepID=A0A409XBP9_PSICY|nr:hypothetical protein CVT25_005140 [Psilocybe cyanescens]